MEVVWVVNHLRNLMAKVLQKYLLVPWFSPIEIHCCVRQTGRVIGGLAFGIGLVVVSPRSQ